MFYRSYSQRKVSVTANPACEREIKQMWEKWMVGWLALKIHSVKVDYKVGIQIGEKFHLEK